MVVAQGSVDAALDAAERFTVYRVRFQLLNDSDKDASFDPVLQVAGGTSGWADVPMVDPDRGEAFYGASDDGEVFEARREALSVADLRLDTSRDLVAIAVPGQGSAGLPLATTTLPAHSFTEVEVAVRATTAANWGASYRFRLAGIPGDLAEANAELVMGSKPSVELSPGQREGEPVDDPVPLYRLDPSIGMTDLKTSEATGSGRAASYSLRLPMADLNSGSSPHVISGLASDTCASCHATHEAQGPMLLRQQDALSPMCFTCHGAAGPATNVQQDWSNPLVPANDPATSAWYSHPATTPSDHQSAQEDEFGGVLNRHTACADCHQPHRADDSRPVNSDAGWTASGAIAGASGVSVENGAAGTAPTYTLATTSSFEYQLCYKCHSSFTQLPAQDPAHPSRWALDKGLELNPANVSYHPVEAAGKNQTPAMTLSLSGTSPYKLWVFETKDTVRCLNCHGEASVATETPVPGADARMDNHASANRGVLIAPYKDRVLNARGQYQAQNFALCYVCHAEAPMRDDSGDLRSDTNFSWHGYHMNDISGNGRGGLDIDVPGAGPGNATCAECHFRTHGTALAVNGQAPATGLVNFAPNVQTMRGVLEFKPATPTNMGTCTLTCHGKPHNAYGYDFPGTP